MRQLNVPTVGTNACSSLKEMGGFFASCLWCFLSLALSFTAYPQKKEIHTQTCWAKMLQNDFKKKRNVLPLYLLCFISLIVYSKAKWTEIALKLAKNPCTARIPIRYHDQMVMMFIGMGWEILCEQRTLFKEEVCSSTLLLTWQVTNYAWLFNKTLSNPRSPLFNSNPAELKPVNSVGKHLHRCWNAMQLSLTAFCFLNVKDLRCEVIVILLLLLHSSVTRCHIAIFYELESHHLILSVVFVHMEL